MDIIQYINNGCLSRCDIIPSCICRSLPFIKNASIIVKQYKCQNGLFISSDETKFKKVNVDIYRGSNPYVLKMMLYLEQFLTSDIFGAYIHGSLGTYEEIPYSDFDALAIIKNEVFDTRQRLIGVARKLSAAQSIMFDFDPLQHHGWFVLTEAQLNSYPEYYFPVELFRHAKSLFSGKGLELKIRVQESHERCKESFNKLGNGIIKRINKKEYPKNMYQLKGLLSQFMLLPSLYVQARDKKGIFKKESFGTAKADFSSDEWYIMDEVSLLRQEWDYEISNIRRFLIARPWIVSRFLAKKYAPVIQGLLKNRLSDDFYQRIGHLADIMQKKLR